MIQTVFLVQLNSEWQTELPNQLSSKLYIYQEIKFFLKNANHITEILHSVPFYFPV